MISYFNTLSPTLAYFFPYASVFLYLMLKVDAPVETLHKCRCYIW